MNDFLKIAFVAVFALVAISVLLWVIKTVIATAVALLVPAVILGVGGFIGYKLISRKRALGGRGRIVR